MSCDRESLKKLTHKRFFNSKPATDAGASGTIASPVARPSQCQRWCGRQREHTPRGLAISLQGPQPARYQR